MAITRAETESAWSGASIVRYGLDELRSLGLPEAAQRSLVQFGLPDRIETLFSSTQLARVKLPAIGDAVRFGMGWNDEFQICVRAEDGEVYAFHSHADEVTYVNKDVESFIEFLARSSRIYALYEQAEQGNMSEEEYLNAVAEAREQLANCDRRALLDGGWWAGIVDEFTMI